MQIIKLFTIIFLSMLLVSCKSKKKDDELVMPIQELYQNGLAFLEKDQYADAAAEFGKIFLQHPGNRLTPQSELMQAYSLFLATEYEDASDILDNFIKLHPMHVDIAYAYYLKGLSYYMQISDVQLDQSRTALAKSSFEDLINRFPNTKYAIDAALKIDLVNDHLAGKEMNIGNYYLKRKNPIAAINRFQVVIRDYQTTSHAAEALYRLALSYKILGLNDDAKKYAAVLGYNYPNSSWYAHAYRLFGEE